MAAVRYGAYICQNHRTFRDDMDRLGFYADQEVKPEFPKILDVAHDVVFDDATAERFRADHRKALAQIVEQSSAKTRATESTPTAFTCCPNEMNAFLPRSDTARLVPVTGFVRKQRYVSEKALSKEPTTTRELLELDVVLVRQTRPGAPAPGLRVTISKPPR